jgi:acetylornithine deacetylase/succinyl-diaminopimelate desuccinylase-like protein
VLVTDLMRLKKEGFVPDRDLIVALTADEEGGTSNGVDWLLKNHRDWVDADFVLNPDAGGVTLDHGRVVDIEIEATEKLYADYELAAHNPGGHSSMPVPDNAIYHVADALEHLQHHEFPAELNPITTAFFKVESGLEHGEESADMRKVAETPPDQNAIQRLSKDPRFNSDMRTTCVATRLSGGHANNALPQTATAVVNCRILPGHSPEEVRQDLIRIIGDPQVGVSYIEAQTNKRLPVAPDKKSFAPPPLRPELMKAMKRVGDEMWPGAPIVPEMETGASDSVYTMAAGMPSYGVSGVAIDRDDVRAHGKDERVRISAYYDGVEFYYRLLKALTSQ